MKFGRVSMEDFFTSQTNILARWKKEATVHYFLDGNTWTRQGYVWKPFEHISAVYLFRFKRKLPTHTESLARFHQVGGFWVPCDATGGGTYGNLNSEVHMLFQMCSSNSQDMLKIKRHSTLPYRKGILALALKILRLPYLLIRILLHNI